MAHVILFCPDRHLQYDGLTPEKVGVGGGVTARVRLGQALAELGHGVQMVCNAPRRRQIRGVEYIPLEAVLPRSCDLLVLNSSGDALDLGPAGRLRIAAKARVVWVHGTSEVKGLGELDFDRICAPSNFVRDYAESHWTIPQARWMVCGNGVAPELQALYRRPRRDPHRLVYSHHPSKGLEAALGILERLRREDQRFELQIFGGCALWGGSAGERLRIPGVVDHGLVGQRRLARELFRASYFLGLQQQEDAFGISLVEAMAAGVVVVASPVGAYREIVRSGYNGVLISGPASEESTIESAVETILQLDQQPHMLSLLRNQARAIPFTWKRIARAWDVYLSWLLSGVPPPVSSYVDPCIGCSGELFATSIGWHCISCGRYRWIPSDSPEQDTATAVAR